jgi:hypothetical protein
MKSGRRVVFYFLFFVFFSALPLYAQGRYSDLEKDLQLSESQRMQVEETKRRYMGELQGLNQEAVNKRLELRELNRNPSAGPEKRERLQRELGGIENSRHNLYNQYRSDLSRVLNQDQRNRYNSYVDSERSRAINRPGYPSMNRSVYPPPYRYQRYPSPYRPVYPNQYRRPDSPPSSMYRPSGPSLNQSVSPPGNRPSAPSAPRGYGR